LPEYMLPSTYFFLDTMPLLPNGKIDRLALTALKAPQLSNNDFLSPVTPLERVLARIWGDILKVEPIGLHDNFFELGGNSLLAMSVVNRIENLFHTQLELHLLFQSPYLQEFANAILENTPDRCLFNDIADFLIELDNLSDAEAQDILAALKVRKGKNLDAR